MKKKYIYHESLPSEYSIDNKQCDWVWCPTCKRVSLTLPCCGNTMCNCGGCDKCIPLQDEMYKLEVPDRESLIKSKHYLDDNDMILLDIFSIDYMEEEV